MLVLDDASLGLPEPGTPLATAAPPARRPRIGLDQNRPNPFNPATRISFELTEAAPVRLTVYDAAGRQVRQLVDGFREAGAHRTRWDGRDDGGRSLGSGVYYYRLQSGEDRITRKMVLVK